MYADVGKSVVRVLERKGVDLDFPEGQTCCGQPAFSSGYYKETAVVAKKVIEVFEKMGEDPTQEFYVKPTDNDVWAFMNKIKEWLFNQRRKGIPA